VFQRSGQASGNSLTIDVGVQGNDRLVVVFVATEQSLGALQKGLMAVDGKSFSFKNVVDSSSGSGLHLEMYAIDDDTLGVTVGSQTITFTPTAGANWGIHAQVWYGAIDHSVYDSVTASVASGISITANNLSNFDNALVVMGAVNSNVSSTYSSWSPDITERTDGAPRPTGCNLGTAAAAITDAATNVDYTAVASLSGVQVAVAACFSSEISSESPSESSSESLSLSPSVSESPSTSPSPSESNSESASISPSVSESPSDSSSLSPSPSLSPSASESPSESPSLSPSASESPSESVSLSPSASESSSESPSESNSESLSNSPSTSPSESLSESPSLSSSLSPSVSESPSESPSSEGLYLSNVESDASSIDLPTATIVNCIFNSTKLTTLPTPLKATEYLKENFIYYLFDFDVVGSGSAFWIANDFNYGVGGLERYGVGAFYFYTPVLQTDPVDPVEVTPCQEAEIDHVEFWDYLTTFWDYLTSDDRDMFENYWHGILLTGDDLIKKARRFYESLAPENARTCVLDDYYDLHIGPLFSKPLNLDVTLKVPNYVIKPIAKHLIEPTYLNEEPIYRDLIEIQANDYYKIRESGLEAYVVVKVKNDLISDKFFKVSTLKSSDEPQDLPAYAEIDEGINDDGNDNEIGKIGIEGLDSTTDISQYTIQIVDNGASASTTVWGLTDLVISIKTEVDSGTTDGVSANQLVDSTQNFLTTVSIGDIVDNITDDTNTEVTVVVDNTTLTLNDDIFVSGDVYRIRKYSTEISSTTTGTLTNRLIDSTQKFLTSVSAGALVTNTTDGTTAEISSILDNSTLILSNDIFVSGETYTISERFSQIDDAINNQSGVAWASLTNKSGYSNEFSRYQTKIPIISTATEIDDLPNYQEAESANGRYYPTSAKVWKWFEGYPILNEVPGVDLATGEWIDSPSKFKYMIVVEGDISYIGSNSFTIYLTTGRAYDIENYVLSMPTLQSFITPGTAPEYRIDRDYTLGNSIVEFKENIFETSDIEFDTYLYCPKVPIIEHMLFELYGTLVDNPDWLNFNYDNYSSKAAINSLLLSIQNSSTRYDYERALNVYYGLPVAPEDSQVVGLYESYGYEIIGVTGNVLTLTLPEGEDLHKFIQPGGKFFIEDKKDLIIQVVNDRALGTVTVTDASDIVVGDKVHVKLKNRFAIKKVWKEGDYSATSPAYVDIYTSNGSGAISHIIDVINNTSKNNVYPEMIISGTDNLENNYNGIYHIKNAEVAPLESSQVIRLSLYKAEDDEDPLYNDYIDVTSIDNLSAGYAHIPWPTHKFLYLLMDGNKYHKAYLDAPIDTIFDEGDTLSQYQTIARNVSVANKTMFPGWYQFDHFRRFHGLNYQSDIVELTKTVPGAIFGDYFPSGYKSTT